MSGLLAGNELGTLIGMHPALRALPLRDPERLHAVGVVLGLTSFCCLVAAALTARRGEAS